MACQNLGPPDRGGLVLGIDLQEPQLPPKFCDHRVKVLQADARLLTPDMLLDFTQDVSACLALSRRHDSPLLSLTYTLLVP